MHIVLLVPAIHRWLPRFAIVSYATVYAGSVGYHTLTRVLVSYVCCLWFPLSHAC